MSEEPPFRRTFSMVYDILENGDVDLQGLGQVLRLRHRSFGSLSRVSDGTAMPALAPGQASGVTSCPAV